MQQYFEMAEKNGVTLRAEGPCQFCGAQTVLGVHECVEIFSTGFDALDFSNFSNHYYRFLAVDAYTLQHSEIHGRWNNHFHLTRARLMYHHNIDWNYKLSPKLSDYLKVYKEHHANEFLDPPPVLARGSITTTDVLEHTETEKECKAIIVRWGHEVYESWTAHHQAVEVIAARFVGEMAGRLPRRGRGE